MGEVQRKMLSFFHSYRTGLVHIFAHRTDIPERHRGTERTSNSLSFDSSISDNNVDVVLPQDLLHPAWNTAAFLGILG